MRKPSPETELRTLRRQLKEVSNAKLEYQREAMALRGELNKAYAETGEWKQRFDQLLSRAPDLAGRLVKEEPSGKCVCGQMEFPHASIDWMTRGKAMHSRSTPCFRIAT